jgi:hypothetical protein
MKRILFALTAVVGLACFAAPATAHEPGRDRDRRPVHERFERRDFDRHREYRREDFRRDRDRHERFEHGRR